MILQTENLTIVRNQQAVISDLNFTLADTEKVVLQGEIGSGKSSFLLALLGFVPLDSGSLHWFGQKCQKEADFVPIRGHHVGICFKNAEDQERAQALISQATSYTVLAR